jgi:hypothetical protein
MQQTALVRRRQHGDRVGGAGRAQVRPLERIDRDVDLVEPHVTQPGEVLRVDEPDLFADVQHRRLVALSFADDDGPVDRNRVHHPAHRLDGHLVRLVTVALAHRVGAGDRRLFDDAEKFERKVCIHKS